MSYNSDLKENNDSLNLLLKRIQDYPIKHPSKDLSYFIHEFIGGGETSYTFHVPFEPDAIYISSDPYALSNAEMYAMTILPKNLSMLGGVIQFCSTAGSDTTPPTAANQPFTATTLSSRYSRNSDGNITITPYVNSTYGNKKFASGAQYMIECVKYNSLSDKERIQNYIQNLPDIGGSVMLNRALITPNFSEPEWTELINTRSNWKIGLF